MEPQVLLDGAGLQETHDASGVPLPPRVVVLFVPLNSPGPQGLCYVSSPAKGI